MKTCKRCNTELDDTKFEKGRAVCNHCLNIQRGHIKNTTVELDPHTIHISLPITDSKETTTVELESAPEELFEQKSVAYLTVAELRRIIKEETRWLEK